jgi:ATP-dependent DNA ligase
MAGLPTGLRGPVQVALAKTRQSIPGEHALPGGSMYDLKWDGFRCALVRDGTVTRLWSRQGKDLTDHFPDVARAATGQVPSGTELDGELVIWHGARLDFDLLQRRLVNRTERVAALAVEHPASYVVFDVLAAVGRDVRPLPLLERRATLEGLAEGWAPPLQVSPMTTSEAQARGWFVDYRPAGIEGLVVKAAGGAYDISRSGRSWTSQHLRKRTRHRASTFPISGSARVVHRRFQGPGTRQRGMRFRTTTRSRRNRPVLPAWLRESPPRGGA